MSTPYDPRAPRPNADLAWRLREIRADWRRFARAKSSLGLWSNATKLVADVEAFLAQPDTLPPDLEPGASPDAARFYIPPDEFAPGDAAFLPEYPFDVGGPGHGTCFFMYGARISPLYEGPSLDPWYVAALHRAVYGVGSFEKIHATAAETSHHVNRWAALTETCVLPAESAPGPTAFHVILVDPRAWGGGTYGTNFIVAATCDLAAAIAAADRWAADLGIRFLVATLRHSADMH